MIVTNRGKFFLKKSYVKFCFDTSADSLCCFQVADMQKELEELQPQLVETAKENTKMMKVCTASLGVIIGNCNCSNSSSVAQ